MTAIISNVFQTLCLKTKTRLQFSRQDSRQDTVFYFLKQEANDWMSNGSNTNDLIITQTPVLLTAA